MYGPLSSRKIWGRRRFCATMACGYAYVAGAMAKGICLGGFGNPHGPRTTAELLRFRRQRLEAVEWGHSQRFARACLRRSVRVNLLANPVSSRR